MAEAVQTFTALPDHFARDADDRAAGGHFLQNDRIGSDIALISHLKRAQYLRSGPDHDVVADGRMALAFLFAAPAQRNPLINHHIVADFTGLPDDHTHAVVDEQPVPDLGPRVNFDTREKPADLGNDASQRKPPPAVQGVSDPVAPDGVQTGVGEHHLKPASGRGIVFEYRLDIGFHSFKHKRSPSFCLRLFLVRVTLTPTPVS
ncbi:hypothetical protein D1872_201180 [compost metagenome]